MRIEWCLSNFPEDPSGYRSVTETIGDVEVLIDGNKFVALEESLILEFASTVREWLSEVETSGDTTFYYKSMDEEEEPLLAFSSVGDGTYIAESCWSIRDARPLRRDEVMNGLSTFLADLKASLLSKYHFSADDAFRAIPHA